MRGTQLTNNKEDREIKRKNKWSGLTPLTKQFNILVKSFKSNVALAKKDNNTDKLHILISDMKNISELIAEEIEGVSQ